MFCKFCGAHISDDSVFCQKCGSKIQESEVNKAVDSQMCLVQNESTLKQDDAIDRVALKIYLGNLRTLELSKDRLAKRCDEIDEKIKILCIPNKKNPKPKPTFMADGIASDAESFVFCVFIGPIIFLLGLLLSKTGIGEFFFGDHNYIMIGFWIMVVQEILHFLINWIFYNEELKRWKNYMSYVEEQNAEDAGRLRHEFVEKNQLLNKKPLVYEEYVEASDLLQKAYDINIIPAQFRNIFAVYYLYEFINTSNEPLSNALLNFNLETIKNQLSVIISQNQQMILNQEVLMAQNEEIFTANQKQLEELSLISQNTEQAAQYAQIAANNAEACAWISLANYIRG